MRSVAWSGEEGFGGDGRRRALLQILPKTPGHRVNSKRPATTFAALVGPRSAARRRRGDGEVGDWISSGLRPIPPPCLGCGLRPLGRLFGYRGRPLGGLLEAVGQASWGRSGASWGFFLGLLGASWGLLEVSCGILGASWGGSLELSVRVPPLGPLLWPSWGPLERAWAPLGPFSGPFGPSWGPLGGLLGRPRAVLGAPGAVLERRKLEKAIT